MVFKYKIRKYFHILSFNKRKNAYTSGFNALKAMLSAITEKYLSCDMIFLFKMKNTAVCLVKAENLYL